ncbi:LacI family DNA-binding transcriptional regulator [Streptomyces sp. UC4497]
MSATSRDVARLAGVAQSTVSYVLNGRRPVSADTRRRVEDAIRELGFQPHAGARALVSRRTRVIGLVVPFGTAGDPAGLIPFLDTITTCARERDHDVLLVTADEGADGLRRLAGRALCDAVVLMGIEADDERIPVAAALRVPVVTIGVPDVPSELHCVDLDFSMAGRLAVEELAACGLRRVVLLGHAESEVARGLNYVARFARGAERAAAVAGLGFRSVSPLEPEHGPVTEEVRRQLADTEGPVGFVVAGHRALPHVLAALRALGRVPGEDAAVVALCTDERAVAEPSEPSNVSTEPREVSRRAMDLLFRLLDKEGAGASSTVELVAPRLTRRATTAVPDTSTTVTTVTSTVPDTNTPGTSPTPGPTVTSSSP